MQFNPTNYPLVTPSLSDTLLLRQASSGQVKSVLVAAVANAANPLFQVVTSISDLVALPVDGMADGTPVQVGGYYENADGGGGLFYYDSTSNATENGGTVIAPVIGGGRWIRAYSGAVNVRWFGAVGNNSTGDHAALAAADATTENGGSVFFPRGRYVVSENIEKTGLGNWNGTPGVDPSNRTVQYGSVLVAGYNGAIVSYPDTGIGYAMYAGMSGVSFYSSLLTYAGAVAISSNGNFRQITISDLQIDGFSTGILGPWGELYLTRAFISNGKYGLLSFGMSDSWISQCHLGSGLSAPGVTPGGAGMLLSNSNNVIADSSRFQVQESGNGAIIRASSKIRFNSCYFDANEDYGLVITNSQYINAANCFLYDNGTTSVNAGGIKIEAVSDTITASASTDEITLTSGNAAGYWGIHGVVQFSNSGGALPTNLVADTEYYLIPTDATGVFKVASSYANAVAGVNIDLGSNGSGTNSILGVCKDITIIGGAMLDRNKGTANQRQVYGVTFIKTALNGAASGIIKNIAINDVDFTGVTTPLLFTSQINSAIRLTNCLGVRDEALLSGSSTTVRVAANPPTLKLNSAITADCDITLSQDGAYGGSRFRICRGTAATGAFNLVVKNSAGTILRSIAADASNVGWVDVAYYAGSTLEWQVVGSSL